MLYLMRNSFDDGSTIPYHHFSVIESTGKLAEVKRRSRVLVSSYPNAFNLSFFNENFGNATFSSPSSTFNDDIYVNGNVNQLNLGSSAIGYSSLTSPSSPMVSHGVPLPEFPSHDPSYFTSVLGTVNGEWESNSGGRVETVQQLKKFGIQMEAIVMYGFWSKICLLKRVWRLVTVIPSMILFLR